MENRRSHARYQAAVVAEVQLDGGILEGETRDISEGGVSLILEQALEEDSQVALQLILTQDGIEDPGEEPFEADARVIWSAPTDDDRSMTGVRFVGVDAQQDARLRRFLAALAE
ncbi:MAG: PilZ domain-containing protein [Myxococcales bacterium]|nr:PilZ domain-containing protein [Myxococcales bacterium]